MQRFMRFPQFKTKAMTLSYDDAVIYDERLISIMLKYGLKGTFNVNGGLMSDKNYRRMNEKDAVRLYKQSKMEVAMHGYNHAYLHGSTGADIVKEFYDDKIKLEKTFGKVMRGGAYAYGVYNDEVVNVLRSLGLAYFRTTEKTYSFDIPKDWLRLKTTCRHADENLFELLKRFTTLNPNKSYNAEPLLFYMWGHSYEYEDQNNWDIIERFGKEVSCFNDIWHATNGEIYDYVHAFDSLIFSADGTKIINPTCIDVYLFINSQQVIARGGKTTKV